MAGDDILAGRKILIVEDDYFIAAELERIVEEAGADVIGPFSRANKAREAMQDTQDVSAAVLDVNIDGEKIYPFAEALIAAGVPIVFATGYDASAIPARFEAVPCVLKPVSQRLLLDTLARVARR